jgi:hypothetical protein
MCQIKVLPSTAYAFNRNYDTEYSILHTRRPENLKFPLKFASVFGYYYFRCFCINSRKRVFYFVTAICLSASIRAAPSGRIFMQLVIGVFI